MVKEIKRNKEIYVISDEQIEAGERAYDIKDKYAFKFDEHSTIMARHRELKYKKRYFKLLATTEVALIKEGIKTYDNWKENESD